MSFERVTNDVFNNPDDESQIVIAHTERFDGLLDAVAEQRKNYTERPGEEMRHLATIPGIILEQYCFQNGVTWHEFCNNPIHLKRVLNDPDLAYFRVAPGQA